MRAYENAVAGLRSRSGAAVYVPCVAEVRTIAQPANAGSRRVLEKAGIEIARFVPEMDRVLCRRRRQELPAALWDPHERGSCRGH